MDGLIIAGLVVVLVVALVIIPKVIHAVISPITRPIDRKLSDTIRRAGTRTGASDAQLPLHDDDDVYAAPTATPLPGGVPARAVDDDIEERTRDAQLIAIRAAAGPVFASQIFESRQHDSYSMGTRVDTEAECRRVLAKLYQEKPESVLIVTYHAEIDGRPHAVFEGYRRVPEASTAFVVPIKRRFLSYKWDYAGKPRLRPASTPVVAASSVGDAARPGRPSEPSRRSALGRSKIDTLSGYSLFLGVLVLIGYLCWLFLLHGQVLPFG